jgi:glycosyltransferase involved in cell wall biosynthesis
MKILLDMQATQCQSRHRGIGRYSLDLAKAFGPVATLRHEVQFAFNAQLDEATDDVVATLKPYANAHHRLLIPALRDVATQDPRNYARRRTSELLMRHGLEQAGADVVWFTSMVEGYSDDTVIPECGLRDVHSVATLYDLIPLHDSQAYLDHPSSKAWYEAKVNALARCDLLLSISEWVRQDALEKLKLDPARIVTIGAGVDPRFCPPADVKAALQRVQALHGISRPYVMYNGGFDPRKNVSRLILAFASLPLEVRETHQLVIVGRTSTEQMAGLQSAMREARLPPMAVVFTGFVSDDALVDLYASCALFVFPSMLEGFGLPPLEAMSCGAPVLASNTTSLPEVMGRADATFDPADTEAIAAAMGDVLTQPARADVLRQHARRQAARFTWEAVATRALHALEQLVEQPPRPPSTDALRTASAPHASTLLAYVHASPLTWLDGNPNFRSLSTASMPHNESWVPGELSACLDSADRIAYVTSVDHLWQTATISNRWPGAWLLVAPAEQPPQPPSLAQRYEAGGYVACMDPAAPFAVSSAGCAGIVCAAGVTLPPALARFEGPIATLPADTAQALANELASCFSSSAVGTEILLLDELARTAATLDNDELARVSDAVVSMRTPNGPSQWLIDVTQIAQRDFGTGIQRVVRSILSQWLRSPPEGVRVEPIALVDGHFRYARRYTLSLLGMDATELDDDFVHVASHDTYIGLDWSAEAMTSAEPILRGWHRRGVGMHFVVNDLLPITLPETFHPFARNLFSGWLRRVSGLADGLHCISAATACELSSWLDQTAPPYQFGEKPVVDCFPLGAEVALDAAPSPLPPSLAHAMALRPTMLMVGTLEPRKGHAQALDAFERLWSLGHEVNFVVVGHVGWMVEALVRRLESHAEQNRYLFWLQDADDHLLESIYQSSTALLAPSFGEGYGLPLVEAAHRGLPVLARDLPVFREIMGDYARYFRAADDAELAQALASWLQAPPKPGPARSWPTWQQSATALARAILEGPGHRRVQTVV